MGATAFVFPGEGSQRVGMGTELLEARPDLFDRYFNLADEASGLPIRKLALEGPIEDPTRTDVTQPALFALSLAIHELARESGLEPDFVAGHSLGEDTAAVAAGALDLQGGHGAGGAAWEADGQLRLRAPGRDGSDRRSAGGGGAGAVRDRLRGGHGGSRRRTSTARGRP